MNSVHVNLQVNRGAFRLDASLTVPGVGITGLYGPSGAGKSTLLRALAGLERGTGEVRIGDEVWQDERTFLPAHARSVGFVFQDACLFEHLNVRDNLHYGYRRTERHLLQPDAVIELLALRDLLERRVDGLSGGEARRVAIGRALLRNPKLLLMDEPLVSLDVARKRELLPFLERLHTELRLPVIYVSHAPDEVARLADHLALIEQGRITAVGPINDTLTRLDLPIAHEHDAGAVVDATVTGYEADYDLSELTFTGGTLAVPGRLRTGAALRARVLARDVSLVLERPQGTSILNIVPVTVVEVSDEGGAQQLIRLDAGGTVLIARITRKSARALDLYAGKSVYAQIKSVAILDL